MRSHVSRRRRFILIPRDKHPAPTYEKRIDDLLIGGKCISLARALLSRVLSWARSPFFGHFSTSSFSQKETLKCDFDELSPGDGKEEAVIFSMCNTGGTGNFTEAYIYTIKDGKPVRIMLISGGDRAFGGLRDASIENGILTIESNDAGKFGGACCPEFVVTNKYRYTGTTLKEVGKRVC